MNIQTILHYALEIQERGPKSVMIEGPLFEEPTTWDDQRVNASVDIVFLRSDGYSIGAPSQLEHEAFSKDPGQWVAYMRAPAFLPFPMESYTPLSRGQVPGVCNICGDKATMVRQDDSNPGEYCMPCFARMQCGSDNK